MKTRTAAKKNEPEREYRDDRASRDDILAVLVDVDNGHEFYMAFIDAFQMKNREYLVMYNYEPDDGSHAEPELTILRAVRHANGEQYFMSIKNKHELDAAFEVFFKRFEESGGL
jgi:uncharacterized protein YrzB (UPF0473 family)